MWVDVQRHAISKCCTLLHRQFDSMLTDIFYEVVPVEYNKLKNFPTWKFKYNSIDFNLSELNEMLKYTLSLNHWRSFSKQISPKQFTKKPGNTILITDKITYIRKLPFRHLENPLLWLNFIQWLLRIAILSNWLYKKITCKSIYICSHSLHSSRSRKAWMAVNEIPVVAMFIFKKPCEKEQKNINK